MFCITCSKGLTRNQKLHCSLVCRSKADGIKRRDAGKLRKENMTPEAYARKLLTCARDRGRNNANRRVDRTCVVCGETSQMLKAHARTRPKCHKCWNLSSSKEVTPRTLKRHYIPQAIKGTTFHYQNCVNCETQFLTQHSPGKYCSPHCKRQIAASKGKQVTSKWITKNKRQAIYSRDQWKCQLCFEAVGQEDWQGYDPKGASLDHIVPRAHGGSDHPDNLRLTHIICNSVRGVSGDSEALVLVAGYWQR